MAGEDGFYLMHRGWQDHTVFRGEAFSKRDAFIWLIEEAAYVQRRVAMPSGDVVLGRGQVGHSYRFMAKAWKWEESKVRRFIGSLQKAEIIDAGTAAGQTVITICNYDKYQLRQGEAAAPIAAAAPQQRRGDAANEKEGKERREEVVVVARASANDPPAVPALPADPDPVPDDEAAGHDPIAWVNRFGQAAGVAVFPSRPKHFADQIASAGRWFALGLDPTADIIPILERDCERSSETRHSLAYFDATMAKAAARKTRANDPNPRSDPEPEHQNPLVRAALRAAATRDD